MNSRVRNALVSLRQRGCRLRQRGCPLQVPAPEPGLELGPGWVPVLGLGPAQALVPASVQAVLGLARW